MPTNMMYTYTPIDSERICGGCHGIQQTHFFRRHVGSLVHLPAVLPFLVAAVHDPSTVHNLLQDGADAVKYRQIVPEGSSQSHSK